MEIIYTIIYFLMNQIQQLLRNPKCLAFDNVGASQINLVDNFDGRCYNIGGEIHELLIEALEEYYNGIGNEIVQGASDESFSSERSFNERVLELYSGFNWRVMGVSVHQTSVFYEMTSILYTELSKILDNFPKSLHFFLRGDEIVIPEIRMTARDREFVTQQLNKSIPELLEAAEITIGEYESGNILGYMYVNRLTPMCYFKCINKVTARGSKEPMIETYTYDRFKMSDVSMLLVKGENLRGEIRKINTKYSEILASFTTTTLDEQTIISDNMKSAIGISDVRYFYEILKLVPDEVLYGVKFWGFMTPLACSGSLYDLIAKEGYKHLVRYYYNIRCQKAGETYDAPTFASVWDQMVNKRSHKIELIHYARRFYKDTYSVLHNQFMIAKIKELGMRSFSLPDGDLAKLLYYSIAHKYGVGIPEYKATGSVISSFTQEWYKFIEPHDEHNSGELYKWKKMTATPDIFTFISLELPRYFESILNEPGYSTRSSGRNRNIRTDDLMKTLKALNMVAVQKNMLSSVAHYLTREYFFKRMDKDPWILGVANGVLELCSREDGRTREYVNLVQGYHGYPISRSIPVAYISDKTTYMVRKVATHLHDFFHEKDVVDWHCFFWSRALDSHAKDPVALLWIADGSRAKTFWQQLLLNSVGSYGKKASNRIITRCETQTATRTELAALEGVNVATFSEIRPDDILDDQKLKMLLGVEDQSLNDKNEKERPYHFNLILWGAMNHILRIVTTDHGTWRRLIFYSPKYTYVDNPDPNDPFQRKDDPNYVNSYANDPEWQQAFITILLHYHSILVTKYNCSIKNVPQSPTMVYESLCYRSQQDILYKFCCHRLIVVKDLNSRNPAHEYECEKLQRSFFQWYTNEGYGRTLNNDAIEKLFKDSILGSYITKATVNDKHKKAGSYWVNGVRDIQSQHTIRENNIPESDEIYMANFLNQSHTNTPNLPNFTGTEMLAEIINNATSEPTPKKSVSIYRPVSLF